MSSEVTTTTKQELIDLLKEVGGRYRETPVILGTGEKTHVYLDVKGVLDRGSRLNLAADAMIDYIRTLAGFHQVTAIGGPTMGADVLAHTIVGREFEPGGGEDLKWFAVRDHAKTDHGLGKWIEGAELDENDYVIITDDVANSGKSLVEAYERVAATGAHVVAIMPLVDRSDKAEKLLRSTGQAFKDGYLHELENVPYLPLLTSADLGLENLK